MVTCSILILPAVYILYICPNASQSHGSNSMHLQNDLLKFKSGSSVGATRKCLVDARDQRRTGRLIQADRKGNINLDNHLLQPRYAEEQKGYRSGRPQRVPLLSSKNRKLKLVHNPDSKILEAQIRPTPDTFIWPTYRVEWWHLGGPLLFAKFGSQVSQRKGPMSAMNKPKKKKQTWPKSGLHWF